MNLCFRSFFVVGVKRLELPTSCSQSRRATNCATPRNSVFFVYGKKRKTGTSPSKILSSQPLPCLILCIFSPQSHTSLCHRQRRVSSPNCATPRNFVFDYGKKRKTGASPSKILSSQTLPCLILCIFSPQSHTSLCHRQRCVSSPNCATPRNFVFDYGKKRKAKCKMHNLFFVLC